MMQIRLATYAQARTVGGMYLCDGREISVADHPYLYAAIGKTSSSLVSRDVNDPRSELIAFTIQIKSILKLMKP